MLNKKALAALGASSLVGLLYVAPAFAEDIPDVERQNIEGAGPDVDPGASQGKDPSIPDQERMNIEGSGPDVDAGASQGNDPSIPDQERQDLR